jgi:hypothetical protein
MHRINVYDIALSRKGVDRLFLDCKTSGNLHGRLRNQFGDSISKAAHIVILLCKIVASVASQSGQDVLIYSTNQRYETIKHSKNA